ncbi:MAG: hypothetical protein ACSHXK_12015 [Oceanococcus sp.]
MGIKANPEPILVADSLPAWQCLAMSLDVDPASLGMEHFLVLNAAQQSLGMLRDDDPKWLQSMAKRWRILAKGLETGKELRADKRRNDVELETLLKFDAFLEFAISKRWALPKSLKN